MDMRNKRVFLVVAALCILATAYYTIASGNDEKQLYDKYVAALGQVHNEYEKEMLKLENECNDKMGIALSQHEKEQLFYEYNSKMRIVYYEYVAKLAKVEHEYEETQ
jgi:hypothetical protein